MDISEQINKLEEKHQKRLIGDKKYQAGLKKLQDEKAKNDEAARKKESNFLILRSQYTRNS